MSYYYILADLHQELNPQQDPDAIIESPDFFESEGKVFCYSDFVLRPDIDAYKQAYKQATEWGGNDEF